MRRFLISIISLIIGFSFPILTASLWRVVSRDQDFRLVTDFGYADFQVSLVPIALALGVASAFWEMSGRQSSVFGYGFFSMLSMIIGIEIFLVVSYGAPVDGVARWTDPDVGEYIMVLSFGVGSAVVAAIRKYF